MRIILGYFVLIFCMIGSPSWAPIPKLVEPQSIYQSAYCAELLRIDRAYANNELSEKITYAASEIIHKGDNIEFAQLGIEDARRKVLARARQGPDSRDEIVSDLEECSGLLMQDIQIFLETSFISDGGYGAHTSSEEAVRNILLDLELPLPEEDDNAKSKISLWQQVLKIVSYRF